MFNRIMEANIGLSFILLLVLGLILGIVGIYLMTIIQALIIFVTMAFGGASG